jgi:hypothetical protein
MITFEVKKNCSYKIDNSENQLIKLGFEDRRIQC